MTSVAVVVLRCPECDGLNRSWALTSITCGMMPAWTDDGGHAWPDAVSYARCACCGAMQAASAFESLGVVDRGAFEYEIRLIALGDTPLNIMRHLRARFEWSLAELKSRLAMLPIDLPPIHHEEDAHAFQRTLLRDGARCDMRARTIMEPDPPERLNAPWLRLPGHPSELAERIPHGDTEELGFRLSLYRLSNDPYRSSDVKWIGHWERTAFEIENVRALLDLLDARDEAHWLLRANIARESGDFVLSQDLLRQRVPTNHVVWHKVLVRLTCDRIARVSHFALHETDELQT